jgi:hypothetical protein
VHSLDLEKSGVSSLDEGQSVEFDTENRRGKIAAVNVKVSSTSRRGSSVPAGRGPSSGSGTASNAPPERPAAPSAAASRPQYLSWLAVAAAAIASYQVGSLIAFWAAQMKGPAANIAELGETPYIYFLNKAMMAARPSAVIAAIIALIAVKAAPATMPSVQVVIVGAVAGTFGGCVVALLVGYF